MTHYGYGSAGRGLMNLNGNVLCVVDTETSGVTAGFNDILEVAVVPLDYDLVPMKDVMPFVSLIRPKNRFPESIDPKAMEVNGIKMEDLLIHGLEPWRAADLFESWAERLQLGPGKKIAPLAFNYPFDRSFLIDWLAPKTFESFFWHRYRDAMPVVLYLNDKAEFEGRKPPFPQTGLQDVRKALAIEPNAAHRALGDALTTAKVYRRLMNVEVSLLPTQGSVEQPKP